MKAKITCSSLNQNKNLVLVEVLDEGPHKGNEYPMWLGEVHKPWQGRVLEVGDTVEASEIKHDELGEEYLTYNE